MPKLLAMERVHLKLVPMDHLTQLMATAHMGIMHTLVQVGDHPRMVILLMDIHIMEVPQQTGLMDIMVGMVVDTVLAGAIKILSVC